MLSASVEALPGMSKSWKWKVCAESGRAAKSARERKSFFNIVSFLSGKAICKTKRHEKQGPFAHSPCSRYRPTNGQWPEQWLLRGHLDAGEVKVATWSSAAIQGIAIGREEGEDNGSSYLICGGAGVELVIHAGAAIRGEWEREVNGSGYCRPTGILRPCALLAAEGDG